jgi:hypothetical protein
LAFHPARAKGFFVYDCLRCLASALGSKEPEHA